MAKQFEFHIVLRSDIEKTCTMRCQVDVFSSNSATIKNYVSELNGYMPSFNTACFSSEDSFAEFSKRLSLLGLPALKKK